jgi:hypothetical protein
VLMRSTIQKGGTHCKPRLSQRHAQYINIQARPDAKCSNCKRDCGKRKASTVNSAYVRGRLRRPKAASSRCGNQTLQGQTYNESALPDQFLKISPRTYEGLTAKSTLHVQQTPQPLCGTKRLRRAAPAAGHGQMEMCRMQTEPQTVSALCTCTSHTPNGQGGLEEMQRNGKTSCENFARVLCGIHINSICKTHPPKFSPHCHQAQLQIGGTPTSRVGMSCAPSSMVSGPLPVGS